MEIDNGQNQNLMNPNEQNFPSQNFGGLQNNQYISDVNPPNNVEYQNQSQENQDPTQNNEKSEETDEKKNPKTLKRRSKSEVEGRTHVCKLCNKSYLSYPALYTHYKLKHNTNNSSGRGRGRPISKEERTGKTEPSEINQCIDIAFNELYSEEFKRRNENREMKNYESINTHPFLGQFKQDPHDISKSVVNEHEMADLVLIDYLNKMSIFCNEQYYIKLIKFVTLFREHVNLYNSKLDKNKYGEQEYTKIKDAEDVPDCSNEFITDFMHPEGNEVDFGFTKDESIDLTQNLCYWMYENNFTCSKLSLINNDK